MSSLQSRLAAGNANAPRSYSASLQQAAAAVFGIAAVDGQHIAQLQNKETRGLS